MSSQQSNKQQIMTDPDSFWAYQQLIKFGKDPNLHDLNALKKMSAQEGTKNITLEMFQDFMANPNKTKTKPLVSEKKPTIVFEKKPAVALEKKPVVTFEKKPIVVFEKERAVTFEKKPIVVSEKKPTVAPEKKYSHIVSDKQEKRRSDIEKMRRLCSASIAKWEELALHVDDYNDQAIIEDTIINFQQTLTKLNRL